MEALKPPDVMMPSRGMGVVDDLIAERLPLHRLWLEADPRSVARKAGAAAAGDRLERASGPDRRRCHEPAAKARNRRQFRRRLRAYRREMGRRAWDHRDQYAGRARRRSRRHRDGADDHGGAPPAPGRAFFACGRVADEFVPPHRVAERPDDGGPRARTDR